MIRPDHLLVFSLRKKLADYIFFHDELYLIHDHRI